MDSQLEHVTLEDVDLAGEVELMVEVIVAVTAFDRHLTAREVDQVLAVLPQHSKGSVVTGPIRQQLV